MTETFNEPSVVVEDAVEPEESATVEVEESDVVEQEKENVDEETTDTKDDEKKNPEPVVENPKNKARSINLGRGFNFSWNGMRYN